MAPSIRSCRARRAAGHGVMRTTPCVRGFRHTNGIRRLAVERCSRGNWLRTRLLLDNLVRTASSEGGTVSPRVLAVLRLMANSNLAQRADPREVSPEYFG